MIALALNSFSRGWHRYRKQTQRVVGIRRLSENRQGEAETIFRFNALPRFSVISCGLRGRVYTYKHTKTRISIKACTHWRVYILIDIAPRFNKSRCSFTLFHVSTSYVKHYGKDCYQGRASWAASIGAQTQVLWVAASLIFTSL